MNMETLERAYQFYCDYNAFFLHFKTDYNCEKYNWKSRTKNFNDFISHRDKNIYIVIDRKIDYTKFRRYLLYYILEKHTRPKHPSDLLNDELILNFKRYIGKTAEEHFFDNFEQNFPDVNSIDDFKSKMKLTVAGVPLLFSLFIQKKITIETMIIIFDIFKLDKYINRKMEEINPLLWEDYKVLIENYRLLFKYNRSNILTNFKQRWSIKNEF